MKLENIKINPFYAPQTGVSVFCDNDYLGTYCSIHELMLDFIYRFNIENIDEIVKKFNINPNIYTIEPYKYRGICSEIFWPVDPIPFKYIYYCNSLSELFEKFEFHEQRAINHEKYFHYGPQGIGIHIFNKQNMKYEYWVGGNELRTVTDVMNKVKEEGLIIPTNLQEEYDELEKYNVFISHKSEDYKIAKEVHNTLSNSGLKVFLSEIELPAIANTDYIAEINKALNNSQNLVVIADKVEKINSGWVKYEWSSFINENLSGRKDGNIITITTDNININELPYMLRQYEVISIKDITYISKWFLK